MKENRSCQTDTVFDGKSLLNNFRSHKAGLLAINIRWSMGVM